jgi:eukaryotic-like serine/threonine-protein kinase
MKRPEQWDKIKEIVGAALEKAASQRTAFLDAACAQNSALRVEVESLVAAYEQSDYLPENPWISQLASVQEVAVIGPYKLLVKLGEGGMGQVWLAEQMAPVKRQVALKLIKGGMFDSSALQRFQSERQSLAIMDHPSIAKVFDAGATPDGQPYFVMEYVPGVSITDYCDQKKLKIPERLELFIKVCEGVQHAHQKAIIHRDLKPANILVVEVDGKPLPRIIDFGLAKGVTPYVLEEAQFTLVGSFLGTPGYMSPEQADPSVPHVDTRTDVYSLGAVLYVLLTGLLPFETEQWRKQPLHEALRQLREEDPPRPSTKTGTQGESTKTAEARGTEPKQLVGLLRGDLDWISMKALERDRARRYATPSELAADIRRHLSHEPVQARPASVSYRMQKYVRRHRIGVAVVGMLAVVLVAFAVVQSVQLRRITRERDRADRIAQFMTGIFKVSDPKERVGDTVTAREVLDKAAQDIDTGLAKDPELQARMMHVMGNAYLNLGLYPRAQWLFERGINVSISVGGRENRETLATMHDLGWVLFQQGHLADAKSLEQRLLDTQRRVLGAEDPDTVATMGELAFTLCEQGNCSEGVKLNRQVLEKQKRLLGPEAYYTLVTMDNLAIMLTEDGRPAEAVKLGQEALEIHLRVFGSENLGSINSMANLAGFQRDLGQDEEAKKLFRQTLGVEERVLGPDQPETAVTKYDLACVLARDGQSEEALSLLRQAVDHGLPPRIDLSIEKEPFLNSLHSDPRFVALVAHAKERAAAQNAN